MMTPISYRCTPSPPSIHTPMLFFTFLRLALCSRITINTPYAIYFFLIHHCTNSLSSLHIFVHHCTFCASLHTKTSPVLWTAPQCNTGFETRQPEAGLSRTILK